MFFNKEFVYANSLYDTHAKDGKKGQEIMICFCDNKDVFILSKSFVHYFETKFTDIGDHFIRNFLENKTIKACYVIVGTH